MKRIKWLLLCLVLTACGSATEPFYSPPECPEGYSALEWSKRDSVGVVTRGYWCLPTETLDSLFQRTAKDEDDGA